jgi:hypothetical protein
MLIRTTGGNSGIREYLEKGQKEGRDFTRDELDERVILAGDLAATDQVINSIQSEGDRYLHITLAFKEDHIPREVMHEIVSEYRNFLFSAYREEEYSFYAEAHEPKLTSYTNKKTGELVERKPHIHIVIPDFNLLSRKKLDLIGKATMQERFFDAFQEHINNKYGLASPKANRRVSFSNASEMISRYKGDMFSGSNQELRETLLAEIIEGKISSYEQFKKLLAERGGVTIRNEGKAGEYLNLKQAGKEKGINLKDFVFTRSFIELPEADKIKALTADIERKYEEAGQARRDPAHITKTLAEWHALRAKELKYINSGNRKFYAAYRAASPEQRQALLAERATAFYQRYYKEPIHGQEPGNIDRIRDNLRAADGHIRAAGRSAETLERGVRARKRRVTNRSAVRAVAAVIQRHAGREAGPGDQARFHDVERPADNVTGQYQADAGHRRNARQAEALSEFAEIKRHLDARRLLAYVATTHGVIVEKYEVTKGKDGSDRIRCGTRNLNVSDFLTAELHLPWKEAAPILRECYAAQLGKEPEHTARAEPRHSSLWQHFQQWKGGRVQQKAQEWDKQKASEKARPREIRATYQAEKARIQSLTDIKHADRKSALSLARMAKVQAEQALAELVKAERLALKQAYSVKASDLFRAFLQERAQAGDEQALAELRRQRIEPLDRDARARQLAGGADPAHVHQDPLARGEQIAYRVALNGDVTYQMHGRDVLRDEPRAVKILEDHDRDVLETGLRLALAKFGPRIQARGDEDFQRRIVQVSVDAGLRVEFTDPALNEYRQQLEAAKRAAIEQARAAAQQQPQAKPTTTTKPTTKERTPMEQSIKPDRAAAEQRRHEEKRRYEDAVQRAKDADLPAWLMERGVKIQKNGTTGWKFSHGSGEPDRIFKSREGNWMVHTKHGDREYMDAIAYAQMHTGLSHRQAVEALSGVQMSAVANGQPEAVAAAVKQARDKGARPDPIVTAVNLREASKQQRENAYQYARSRGISAETLAEAGREQKLIQADHRGLVFVGYDEKGRVRSAETRFIKAEKIGDEMTNKMCYAGTDKTFPPILRGNDKDVHFVEGGFDALALRDMYLRENKEPPTTIITGGARTTKWQDNQVIRDLVKNADHVRPWYDNEINAHGQVDAKKQADTTEAHDKQRDIIIDIRGTAEGVEEMRPPAGIKDIAEWNVEAAHAHQVKVHQEEEEEAHRPRIG